MSALSALLSAAAFISALVVTVLVWRVVGDMASDEVRGWLDLAPRAILRLAGARLTREQRERLYHEEWLPELHAIMREAETRPITRAIRAFSFALGLLLAARAVARLRPPEPQPAVKDGPQMGAGPTMLGPGVRALLRELDAARVQVDLAGEWHNHSKSPTLRTGLPPRETDE